MGRLPVDPDQNHSQAWNAGRKLGAKRPLNPNEVWAILLA
jgi:hypothetical protein